jgi:hypothetical protein
MDSDEFVTDFDESCRSTPREPRLVKLKVRKELCAGRVRLTLTDVTLFTDVTVLKSSNKKLLVGAGSPLHLDVPSRVDGKRDAL